MRRIVISVLLSFFCPGLGQYYNHDYKKGHIIIALTAVLFLLPSIWIVRRVAPHLTDPQKEMLTPEKVQSIALEVIGQNRHLLNLISFTFLGVWAYAITQSYFKAKDLAEKEEKETEEP